MSKPIKHFARLPHLQHRIIFLEDMKSAVATQEEWQEKIIAFASIKPVYPNGFMPLESFNFGHIVAENFTLFTLRFIQGINTKMRILFKQRQFEIKRIINIAEQDRWLEIIALEI